MKEFVEKLIGRLEKQKKFHFERESPFMEYRILTLNEIISIVNQFAEEYNNGWIPCSERLPKENIQVIVTAEKGGHRYTTDAYFYNGKFYNKHYYKIPVGELNDSSVGDNVLAWMPLPAPFKKGE